MRSWWLTRNSLALQSNVFTLRAGALGYRFRMPFSSLGLSSGSIFTLALYATPLEQPCQRYAMLHQPAIAGVLHGKVAQKHPRIQSKISDHNTDTNHTHGGILRRLWWGLQPMNKATARTTGWSMSTEYFTIQSSHVRLSRGMCLYFLLELPDVLPEAECRCWGLARSVLALEMLPLAVVQGQL